MSEDEPAGTGHWFEPVADHLGEAYLRYSFTRGTVAEVDGIEALVELRPGSRILDVGCGPGRHALELARRGHDVVGVDISRRFVELAAAAAAREGLVNARFEVGDARLLDRSVDELPGGAGSFDLALSLCQGAFGLTGGPGSDGAASSAAELDEPVLRGMARAVVPGGAVVVSAFSAYFQLRFEEADDRFAAEHGINEEPTTIRNVDGETLEVRLWTTCYTPRELRLLARAVGLEPLAVHGAIPGRYRPGRPGTDHPEFLLVARRP